ncbi:MAG: UDP-N-acetylglucosamine 2-epimerase [Candidatus Endonucleobacter sp. (ex Gigantidas childressi)]|nr:UDP-N-acetylglucosamine 2-epimerase [Candidatus Endonucleobacter sp. (ex Gigantidas childressi)]
MKILTLVERRADYSRMRPILKNLYEDSFFDVYLVVTGVCLLDIHGKDIYYIKEDGFTINAEIPMFEADARNTNASMVRALAKVLYGITTEIENFKPDLVLTGFDIGANLATTIAAAHMNIPVAHIQGGEVTGSIDESIRHAMSKFSHIHFPATEDARKRLIRLGENPDYVFNVGCPSIDTIVQTPMMDKNILEKKFNIDFSKPAILLIQHSVTTESDESKKQILKTIEVIKELDVQALVALPNNDAGSSDIIDEIKESGLSWYPSLSTKEFVNVYRNIWAVVGNSSSGIHESSMFGIMAVNIGTRQQGRERAGNVIDVGYDKAEIKAGIEKALLYKSIKGKDSNTKNPYGIGDSSKKIVEILKTISLDNIIQKRFHE